MADDAETLAERLIRLELDHADVCARLEDMKLREAQQAALHQQLESALSRYADLYQFAPIAYLTLDRTGLVLEANLTSAALFGRERAVLVKRALAHFVVEEDRRAFLEHMRRLRAGEVQVRSELRFCFDGSTAATFELTSRPIQGLEEPEFLTVLFDLRNRLGVEAVRQRLQEEALELRVTAESARAASVAKDRFFAVLSHELRTPLTPVIAALDLIETHAQLPTDLERPLAVIRRNVEAEVRLVDDLLDVTRIAAGKLRLVLQHVSLPALADEVVEDAAHALARAGMQVRVDVDVREAHVHVDPHRIKQVIRNLLDNAIKFGRRDTVIALRIDNPRPGRVRVEVTDEGIGLSREQLSRVFLAFEQVEPSSVPRQGLGLGLTICKGIVEAHRGVMHAYSAGVEKGARFAFELDTASWHWAPPPQLAPLLAAAAQQRRVLLVEDHVDSARALSTLLEGYGYQVQVAGSIASAVERAAEECDVLVSDLELPDGSGHALLERLPRAVPAIAVSGSGASEDLERSRAAGFVEHLVKPVSGDQLVAAIKLALGERDRSELATSPSS